jgi:hypothetical protein
LLIFTELITLIVGFINLKIIGYTQMDTLAVIKQTTYDTLTLRLDFLSTVNFSNVGIGILIILLSQVIKEAVLVKQENELTI